MSESLVPADAAMSVLKAGLGLDLVQSGDKVEKILPLLGAAVALGFGVHGAKRGAGLDFNLGISRDEGIHWDPEFSEPARIEDPITGGYLMGEEGKWSPEWATTEDPNAAQRVLGGVVGATQVFNPFKVGGKLFRRVGSKGSKGKVADDAAAAGRQAQNKAAAEILEQQPGYAHGMTHRYRAPMYPSAAPRHTDASMYAALNSPAAQTARVTGTQSRLYPHATHSVDDAGNIIMTQNPFQLARQSISGGPRAVLNRTGNFLTNSRLFTPVVGRGLQMLGPTDRALGGDFSFPYNPDPDAVNIPFLTDTSGTGTGGATPYGTSGLESANYGDMGVSNVSSFGTPEQQIWQQGGQKEWSGQFGGGPQNQIKTGENMNIGEQMLKEASIRMLEKDDKKKPKGGGIVLVIGHGKGDKKGDDSKKDGPC